MPAIPRFDSSESYGFTPVPTDNPTADSGAAAALASGASQVSQASDALGARAQELLADVAAKQRRNQQLSDATSIDSQSAIDQAKLQEQFARDPDYQTAPARMQAALSALKQKTLALAPDPQVASIVGRNFDQRASTSTIAVMHASLQNGNASQLAAINTSADAYTKLMAGAADPGTFKQNLDNMAGSYAGAAQGGLINPEQQRVLTSQALRNALTIRAATDPAGAKMLFDQNAALLTGMDFGAVSEHLQPLVDRAQDNGLALGIIRRNGGGGGADSSANAIPPEQRQALVQQAVAGTPIPPALLAAQVEQESGWDPGSLGSAGEIGLGQIKPSTAQNPGYGLQGVDPGTMRDPLANLKFTAQYLYGRGKAAGLQDGDWQNPAKVAAALKAYNGGGDPNYAQNVMRHMAPGAAAAADVPATLSNGDPAPDLDVQLKQADTATAGLPLDRRMYVFNRIRQNASEWHASHAVEIADLNHSVANLSLAYQQGLTQQDPPEAQIRQLLPKEANGLIDQLKLNRMGGDAINAMRFATPEETTALMQQWAPPGSAAAGKVKMVGGVLAGPGTLPAALDNAGNETPDHLRIRLHVLGALQQAAQQKATALKEDPAAYVAGSPDLAPLVTAMQAHPDDPATFDAYARASLAAQARLGVPDFNQRVLSASASQAQASALINADPSKTDVGAALDGMAARYGASWPNVWHDLVRDGKMPDAWQVVAQMPAGPDRIGMQRSLQVIASKGGLKGMREDISSADAQTIRQGLDDNPDYRYFAKTVMVPGVASNPELLSSMRSAIEANAMFRLMNGADASTALTQAAQAALPYDWMGTARAPRGRGELALRTGTALLQSLRPDDLHEPAGGAGMAPADKQAATLRAVQRGGSWVNSPRGDGWDLVLRDNNGAYQFPLRRDGSHVGFKFADMDTSRGPPPTWMPSSPIDVQ